MRLQSWLDRLFRRARLDGALQEELEFHLAARAQELERAGVPRTEAQRRDLPKVLYLNLDDSLGKKDKQTHCLEPVDWFHDHNESTPQKPRYHNAFCYVECTARVGNLTVTLDLEIDSLNPRQRTYRQQCHKQHEGQQHVPTFVSPR